MGFFLVFFLWFCLYFKSEVQCLCAPLELCGLRVQPQPAQQRACFEKSVCGQYMCCPLSGGA